MLRWLICFYYFEECCNYFQASCAQEKTSSQWYMLSGSSLVHRTCTYYFHYIQSLQSRWTALTYTLYQTKADKLASICINVYMGLDYKFGYSYCGGISLSKYERCRLSNAGTQGQMLEGVPWWRLTTLCISPAVSCNKSLATSLFKACPHCSQQEILILLVTSINLHNNLPSIFCSLTHSLVGNDWMSTNSSQKCSKTRHGSNSQGDQSLELSIQCGSHLGIGHLKCS